MIAYARETPWNIQYKGLHSLNVRPEVSVDALYSHYKNSFHMLGERYEHCSAQVLN